MKKILLLLFLIPNLVMAKTCFIHEGKNTYDKLKACEDGDQLHFTIRNFGSKNDEEAKATLIGKRATYCDLTYEAPIEQVSSTSTLTCIFKNHLK